jgi:hypothetical protein
MAQNQPNLDQTRQDIKDIAAVTEETFRSVAANIQDMFANALNASDTVIKSFQKDISNSIKSAARESSKLADNFERMNQGVLKQADIQKQIEARAAKLRSIEVSTAALRRIGTAEAISQANELNQQYQDLVNINQSYTEELNKQIELLNKVDDNLKTQLGLAPQILGGLDKSLKKLGLPDLGFNRALEDTRKIAIQNELNGEETNIWATYTKNLGNNFKEILSTSNLLQLGIGLIIDAIAKLDKSIGDTAKQLGISYDQATQLSQQFNAIANESGNVFVTTKGINESFNQINAALGTNANLNKELLVTQTELVKQAFYSVEAATMLSKLSLATGKPAKEIVTSFLGQAKALNLVNGTAINEKQLLESISKVSKSTLATFASQPGKLAEAAYEAKKLGLELDQLQGIQNSLLDIESSIAAEFEAEVITGKQLNLERARYFALTNDLAGLSKELANQDITRAKFGKMTVIAQEATAKAMGMSKDQMAGMLLEQEAISKLSQVDGANAKEKFNNLVKQVGLEEAKKRLGDDTLAQQMASASTQDRFLASVEKLKEAFTGLAEPLIPIVSAFADAFVYLSKMPGVLTVIQTLLAGMAVRSIATAIASIFTGSAALGPVGLGIAAAATVGMMALIKSSQSAVQAGDIDSPAKGKTQISTKEGGLFELSKNDDIVAFPGASQAIKQPKNVILNNSIKSQPSSPTQTQPSPTINNDALGKVIGEHVANAFRQTPVQTIFPDQEYGRRYQQTIAGVTTRKI